MTPMGEYKDFADCVAKNSDKDDPKAYCGTIKLATEGKSRGGFLRSALKAIEDLLFLGGDKEEGLRKKIDAIDSAYREQTRGGSAGVEAVSDTAGWVDDVFDGYVIVRRSGGIFKVPFEEKDDGFTFDLAGATEMKVEYVAKTGEGVMPAVSEFRLTKDAEGRLRWLAVPTNNFRDRDTPAQIIEAAAHKEFVEYVDKSGDFPVLELWHTAGTEFGKADMIDFDHGFLIMSGTIDAGKEALAERVAAESGLAMSHGFRYTFSDQKKQIIGRYRMSELSVLPAEWAANPWTAIEIVGKENKAMQQQKKGFLARLLGQDVADALDKGLAQQQQNLVAAGVESKEAKAEPAPPVAAVPTAEQIAEAVKALVTESEVFKAFGDAVDKLTAEMAAMSERVKAVEGENAALKDQIGKKQADLVKEALLARADANRPTASKENVVKTGDALAKAAPKPADNFMSSLAGAMTQPR